MRSLIPHAQAIFATFSFAGVLFVGSVHAQPSFLPATEHLQRPFGEADVEIFSKPPKEYRPETWFHFIGGNVSKPGITADLEAIAEAGISGVQLFHGQFGGPWPGVEPQIPCLSKDWDDAVKHTAEECRRLGLRFTMQNCPGWAMSGGPWIEPSNAMRHLVWSRIDFQKERDAAVDLALPKPQPSGEPWRDYRDLLVLAFPTPVDDTNMPLLPERITSNRGDLPWAECFSTGAAGKLTLPPTTEDDPAVIEVSFARPQTLRTVELSSINGFLHAYCYDPGINVKVEAVSDDGQPRPVLRLDLPQASWQDDRPISLACDETTSKVFRVTIGNKHAMRLDTLRFFGGARKNNWESEAGWTLRSIVREGEHPKQNPLCFVDPERILDVSDKMNVEGGLEWTVPFDSPSGAWTVLRIGHVNTGMRNAPAPPEGTGWECDKLSTRGPDAHFAGYIGRLAGKGGALENGLLDGMLLDSWECKTQTWTPGLDEVFAQKTGYSLKRYLPAVFGYVVADHETSKRFLRDWRGTIGDLFANRFYGRMAELARENGLAIQYETAAGDIFPADILEYFKHADVPMCEFWHPMSDGFVGSLNFKPIKPTASAARVYGKPRVSAEAFTSFNLTWDEHWEMLKDVFNVNAAEGVTHCIFHTYTHNPRTDFLPPGTAFGSSIGTPFLRGQTWWPHMPVFTDYLSRCCFLLERGKPVSDVLWYLGDEIDHKPDQLHPFPAGYKYDYCNPDVLLNRLSVDQGDLVTPEGIRYRVLWMPNCKRMLPETLEKLLRLVRDGARIVGDRPEGLATLIGGEEAEKRFDNSVRELWGDPDASDTPQVGLRNVGQGVVVSGMDIGTALQRLVVVPDLVVDESREIPIWLHRRTEDADWYFLAAPQDARFIGMVDFRDGTEFCELWDPATGKIREIEVHRGEDGRIRPDLRLHLPKAGSCFVVFHKEKRLAKTTAKKYTRKIETQLGQEWTVEFPEGWGAPRSMKTLLKPWKDFEMSAEGKAFSGTAKYSTRFSVDAVEPEDRYRLDLGEVEFIAVIHVNGKEAGTLWAAPYLVDITEFLKPGENALTVEVTGTWFNRLVYDAGLPEEERKTWTISGPGKDNPLRRSGLIGPVVLRHERLPE